MRISAGNLGNAFALHRTLRNFEVSRQFQDDTVSCRRKCQRLIKPAPLSAPKIADYHETSETALCLMRCRKDMFGGLSVERTCNITRFSVHTTIRKMSTYHDMEERKPYQYMHICYYHQGELSLAVQSAYTFLVANPTDKDILASLKWYMERPGYDDNMLIDMERKDHEAKFINGVEAYDGQDWGRCVHEFESSLEKAMVQDEKCRILCQDKVMMQVRSSELLVFSGGLEHSWGKSRDRCSSGEHQSISDKVWAQLSLQARKYQWTLCRTPSRSSFWVFALLSL